MTVPDKHYLLSKSWNKGCGLPLIKNYDKLAATVAMVAEFFIKMVAAACSNVVVCWKPKYLCRDIGTEYYIMYLCSHYICDRKSIQYPIGKPECRNKNNTDHYTGAKCSTCCILIFNIFSYKSNFYGNILYRICNKCRHF